MGRRGAIGELRAGDVASAELVERARTSKPLAAYSHRTRTVAALERARELGLSRAPGQDVDYVVVRDELQGPERVQLPFEAPDDYDTAYYVEALTRAGLSVLSPFGYDRRQLDRALRETTDRTLQSYH